MSSNNDETKDKKKKTRSANFTPRETQILLSLVSNYKNIVENKKTDAMSTSDKNRAWEKITSQFNSACPEFVNRSTESLKKYYDNKKRNLRKVKAEERKAVLLTGGGPPPRPEDDPAQELLLSIVDPVTVFGGKNEFDSDSFQIPNKSITKNTLDVNDDVLIFELRNSDDDTMNNSDEQKVDNTESKESQQTSIDDESTVDRSWKKQTIAGLKTKTSNVLKRPLESHSPQPQTPKKKFDPKRRRPTSTIIRSLSANDLAEKYKQLADKKMVIADYKLADLKHNKENVDEEHKLKCEKLKNDIDISKEEHKLKCKLLTLEIILKEKELNSSNFSKNVGS